MRHVLVDASVVFHLLHNRYLKAHHLDSSEAINEWVRLQLCYFMGGQWLPHEGESFTFHWLMDSKPYWRQGVYSAYKGGRKPRPESFIMVANAAKTILSDRGYPLHCAVGYEADDMAACFVQQAGDRQITLATVDKDWKGLISHDTRSIDWYSLVSYRGQSEYRHCQSLACLNRWLAFKGLPDVNKPEQIWSVLSKYGDSADGLPKGSPIELIDLFNPPQEHRLWERLTVDWQSGKSVTARQAEHAAERLREDFYDLVVV